MVRRIESYIDLPTPAISVDVEGSKLVSADTRRPLIQLEVPHFFGMDTEEKQVISTFITASKQDITGTSKEIGELRIDFFRGGAQVDVGQADRAHIYHLEVSDNFRNIGVGSLLIESFKQYIMKSNISKVSMRIGNGNTEKFLINRGIEPKFVETIKPEDLDHNFVIVGSPMDQLLLESDPNMGIRATEESVEGVSKEELFSG